MDDSKIVDLYWQRCEQAIDETQKKYGSYCYKIAYNILTSKEDAEESVNDTYMTAWNTIPPRRPSVLATFLGKITRHISIDRWRTRNAYKRGGGQMVLALEELEECIASSDNVEQTYAKKELLAAYKHFIEKLPATDRRVFLCRYWYLESIGDIAKKYGFSESKVKSMLHRTRQKLHRCLVEEGLL